MSLLHGYLALDALRARNPRLLVRSVSGFGQTGPHRDYLCPDIVGFAMGGLMYISGDSSLPPVKPPETQSYYFASVYAALGTMLALWQRGSDGQDRPLRSFRTGTTSSSERASNRLRGLARGSHVLLQAFDAYVLGRPRIDEIEARIIPDDNTLIANVLSGTIDVTLGNSLSIEQAMQFRDQ